MKGSVSRRGEKNMPDKSTKPNILTTSNKPTTPDKVSMEYIEICNDEITDLLADGGTGVKTCAHARARSHTHTHTHTH